MLPPHEGSAGAEAKADVFSCCEELTESDLKSSKLVFDEAGCGNGMSAILDQRTEHS
jgi:hypothetical protein